MARVCLLLLIVLVAGCDSGFSDPTFDTVTTSTVTTSTVTTTTVVSTSSPSIPSTLTGFALATVSVDGEDLLVAVASDGEERRRGLMGVTDLGDLDGMLFVFEHDVTVGFWMKDTLIPLDIAFFTSAGEYVDGFAMGLCASDPCPTYRPDGSYRYALEMPAGAMPEDVSHITVER